MESNGDQNQIFGGLVRQFGPYPEPRAGQVLVISMDKPGSKTINTDDDGAGVNTETERYKNTSRALTDAGLPHERWRAIRGKSLTMPQASALVGARAIYSITQGRDSMWDIVSWGAVGCALSHAAIWRHVVEHGLPWVVVIEDDAVPVYENTRERIDTLVKEAGGPTEFDVLMLQHKTALLHGGRHKNEPVWRGSSRLRRSFGMGLYAAAYVVTQRGARKLLCNLFPLDLPVDVRIYALARFSRIGRQQQERKAQDDSQNGKDAPPQRGGITDGIILLQATPQLFKHPLLNNFIATDINNVSLKDATIFVPKQIALPLAIVSALLILGLIAALVSIAVRLSQTRRKAKEEQKEVQPKKAAQKEPAEQLQDDTEKEQQQQKSSLKIAAVVE